MLLFTYRFESQTDLKKQTEFRFFLTYNQYWSAKKLADNSVFHNWCEKLKKTQNLSLKVKSIKKLCVMKLNFFPV